MSRRFRAVVLISLLVVLGTVCAHAQFNSGIEGTVADSTGAAVPGATVVLRSLDTGSVQTTKTTGSGYYRFNSLAAASFTLTASAQGFQTVLQRNIQLEVANTSTVNMTLPVGAVSAEVTVTDAPPQLQTAEASVSSLISKDDVQELPLVGRNFYTLVVLTPGVTGLPSGGGQAYAQASADIFNGEYGVNMNANGLRSEQNGFMVDGISVTSMVRGGVANMNPNADSIQELRVSVNTYSAEYGGAGAHVDAITKSGTNQLHGNADWFTTNNHLAAASEYQTTGVPTFSRNEFAGAIGGPVRKDKTFFFATIDALRSSVAFALPNTVETPDFIAWMTKNVPNHVSTAILTKYPSAIKSFTTTQSAGQLNKIDCSTLASASTPITTQAGSMPCNLAVLGTGNLNVTTPRNGLQWGLRGDQMLNQSKDRLDVSLYRTSVSQVFGTPSAYYPYFTTSEPEYTLNAHVNETHIFGPSLLNDFVASYVRLNGKIPCVQCDVPFIPFIGGAAGIGDIGPITFIQNNFEYRDNMTWQHGAHSFKFGGNFLKLQSNFSPIGFNTRPNFLFFNPFAFAADQPFQEAGFHFNPVTGSRNTPAVAERQPMTGAYFQDTWKLKSNLTLNLGLRWENFGKVTEATEVTNLIFQGGNDFVSQITNAKVDVVPSILTKLRYGNFGPRIGVAWSPFKDGKTSIRTGFGRFYDPYTSQVYGGSHFNPPVDASGVASIFAAGPQPLFALGTSGTAPFGFPYPTGIQLNLDSKNGVVGSRVAITGTDPHLPTAYSQNWFLGIQHAINKSLILEADYIGSEGHHLYELYDVNRFAGDLVQNNGVLKRYNQSFGAMSYAQGNLNSFYTGSAFSVRSQNYHGLTVNAAYTFGKAIDEQSSFSSGDVVDAANPGRQRGRADFDARRKLSLSVVWQLPGSKLDAALLRNSLGGWQLSTVTILQSGTPFSVYTTAPYQKGVDAQGNSINVGGDYNADGNNYDYPNTPQFGNARHASRPAFKTGIFKTTDFPVPGLGQEGNLGRNTFEGPGFANTDMTFARHIPLPWFGGDKADVEVRAEAFNVFNRVNYSGIVGDLSNSQFGRSVSTFGARDVQFGARLSF